MKSFLIKILCFVCSVFKALTVRSCFTWFVQEYIGLTGKGRFLILGIPVLINLSFASKDPFSLGAEPLCMANRHQPSFQECLFFVEMFL